MDFKRIINIFFAKNKDYYPTEKSISRSKEIILSNCDRINVNM